ncbi:hypothetical protein POPTR_019G094650v4 [Populus trichocarpa]|uniref:Uncharacterized protein n=1 Tax=Populus trichocarpa TaxID=3694 RepID=A0ACC0RL47_POPTR|nr:hypothetical protein POPTR_019G094650v4 [Populus trichocarpa]
MGKESCGEGDDEENGFVLASSWGKNGKGELR